jgi:mono/diheme cytochrome c family protein
MKIIRSISGALIVLLVASIGVATYLWSGGYNVAADDAHTKPVLAALTAVRERSIEARARDIKVPDLGSAQMVTRGAHEYAEMCVSCHLAPGAAGSDIRPGLNPQPPDFTRHAIHDPAQAFWVIKHGIKMSGMPAWGQVHDDDTLWTLVAFLQRMPTMSADEYRQHTAETGESEAELHHHSAHGAGAAGEAQHHH